MPRAGRAGHIGGAAGTFEPVGDDVQVNPPAQPVSHPWLTGWAGGCVFSSSAVPYPESLVQEAARRQERGPACPLGMSGLAA
ncbi:hypothetical protein C1I97_13150 [Streptomyces sp. NTH33]|nr:hypothetical protein C1I97_13150 [Streptomyces sp. NTH33]